MSKSLELLPAEWDALWDCLELAIASTNKRVLELEAENERLREGLRNTKLPDSAHQHQCAFRHDDDEDCLRGECDCGLKEHNQYIDTVLAAREERGDE